MRGPAATRTRQPQEGTYLFLGSWEGVGSDNHDLLLQKAPPDAISQVRCLGRSQVALFQMIPAFIKHHPRRQLHRDDGEYFDVHQSLEGCGSPMHPEWENLVTH